MVVNLQLTLSDEDRRRLRLALGHRGGKATRAETKAWALAALKVASQGWPEAPRARVKHDPDTSPLRPAHKADRPKVKAIHYNDIANDYDCDRAQPHRCGRSREDHGALGYCWPDESNDRFQVVGFRVLFAPRPNKPKGVPEEEE